MHSERWTLTQLNQFTTPPCWNPDQLIQTPAGIDSTINLSHAHVIIPFSSSRGCDSITQLQHLLSTHKVPSSSIGFHWVDHKIHGRRHKGFFLVRPNDDVRSGELLDAMVYATSREYGAFSVVPRSCVAADGPNAPGNSSTTIKLHNVPESATIFRLKGAAKPGGHFNCVRIHVDVAANTGERTAALEFMQTPFTAAECSKKQQANQRRPPRRKAGPAVQLVASDIPDAGPTKLDGRKDGGGGSSGGGSSGGGSSGSSGGGGWGKSGWKNKGTDGGNPSGRDRNVSRSRIFRKWLEETFGKERLLQGCGIMDVAGGKGELAWELQGYGEMPSTIVDPRPLDIVRMMKALTANKITRLRKDMNASAGRRVLDPQRLPCAVEISLPLPKHVRCWFDYPMGSSKNTSLMDKNIQMYHNDDLKSDVAEETKLMELAKKCSACVGMHADQATEAIVDFGLATGKPFAVVPCCVFPQMFPDRRTKKKNKPVRSYKEFCEYLEDKGAKLAKLDFPGRNVVVYGNV